VRKPPGTSLWVAFKPCKKGLLFVKAGCGAYWLCIGMIDVFIEILNFCVVWFL